MASHTLRRRSSFRATGRRRQNRSHPILRVIVVVLVGLTMFTSGASAGAIFFYGQNLPTIKNFKARFEFQNTIIRDWQGRKLYDMADISKNRGRRVVRPLAWPGQRDPKAFWLTGLDKRYHGIPLVMQDATIATEDASFYSNLGFDPLSILRAGYDNFTKGHIVSGASTITQQLVREYMLNDKPTLSRKAEEIVLAAELTQKYPKSEILWYYINSVPYGNLTNGVEAAAEQYFHQHVWQLDLAKSALLAGLPEAPSIYNPVNNLPAALSRMHYVLRLMCVHGFLDKGPDHQCAAAIAAAMNEAKTWPKFTPPVTIKRYPHFVQYAIDQLNDLSKRVDALKGRVYNGLDVTTTLDERLQNQAQAIVKARVDEAAQYHVTDGALVAIDLRQSGPDACYGCIRAMVGSADYNNKAISGEINMADSPRQPGSSFKPFSYIYAFQHGLAPNTTVDDAPISIPDPGNPEDGGVWSPSNYDHTFHGVVTLRTALQNSLNSPAIKVEQYNASIANNGLWAIRDQAERLGVTSFEQDNPHCCGWALTLGGLERGLRLVEETSAYGTFGTGGMTDPPIAIWKVKDRTTGQVLYDASKVQDRPDVYRPKRVLDPAYAYLMNNVLSDNNSRCAAVCEFGLDSPLNVGRTAAAKTGTTENFTDNWTVGYTPDIVTGVWVGNADNTPMVNSTGITGAAPIWHDFMLAAFKTLNLPPKDFPEPGSVQAGSECRLNTPYVTFGTTVYDLYAGVIPYCSIGGYNATLPAPASTTSSAGVGLPAASGPPAASGQAVQPAQPPPPTAPPQPTAAPAPIVQQAQPAPTTAPGNNLPPGVKPLP
ncbi:MAG: transglycosylase domain-containing protein [Chloroflexi bacterium]|nr:transglycosylase domain-containing protein [Chloroflexota bacterium]